MNAPEGEYLAGIAEQIENYPTRDDRGVLDGWARQVRAHRCTPSPGGGDLAAHARTVADVRPRVPLRHANRLALVEAALRSHRCQSAPLTTIETVEQLDDLPDGVTVATAIPTIVAVKVRGRWRVTGLSGSCPSKGLGLPARLLDRGTS